jgi:hypothetical protein
VIEAVQQALVKIVESSGNVSAGAEVKDGVVIASATRISEMMKSSSHDFYNINKSPKTIGAALRKLANAQGESNPVRLWHVSIEILLRYAIETGAPCERLRQVYADVHGDRGLVALQNKIRSGSRG